jgi:2-oxoglutarate ferredoxin oxidoreductase subunit alpha
LKSLDNKILIKGNEAIAEAAIRSGCKHYYGYPITPQTELTAYMAKNLPPIGGTFIQAESEVAAINMVYGSAAAGARTMTSSSSPGISLKAEGISYIAAADLPCVIVNIMRAGPGLGGIQPSGADYFQATKACGHGDYHLIVLAPNSVQEIVEITYDAFDIADKYRVPVMILGDSILGQMMEPADFSTKKEPETPLPNKDWAATGTKMKREHNVINTLYLRAYHLEKIINERQEKYNLIKKNETRFSTYLVDDAEYVIVAYGTMSRIAKSAIDLLRNQGVKVGMIRPITLYPFPDEIINTTAKNIKSFLCVEMSMGQMIEDVKLAVNGICPVEFYGRTGGVVPNQIEIVDKILEMIGGNSFGKDL